MSDAKYRDVLERMESAPRKKIREDITAEEVEGAMNMNEALIEVFRDRTKDEINNVAQKYYSYKPKGSAISEEEFDRDPWGLE